MYYLSGWLFFFDDGSCIRYFSSKDSWRVHWGGSQQTEQDQNAGPDGGGASDAKGQPGARVVIGVAAYHLFGVDVGDDTAFERTLSLPWYPVADWTHRQGAQTAAKTFSADKIVPAGKWLLKSTLLPDDNFPGSCVQAVLFGQVLRAELIDQSSHLVRKAGVPNGYRRVPCSAIQHCRKQKGNRIEWTFSNAELSHGLGTCFMLWGNFIIKSLFLLKQMVGNFSAFVSSSQEHGYQGFS